MAGVGLHPYSCRGVCVSVPNQRTFSARKCMLQRSCQVVAIQSSKCVDLGLLANPKAARSPLLVSHRRSCRRNRLIPVRSAALSQAQQAFRQSQSFDVRPLTSLLVPAVAGLLLSKVVDGKGIMLATYWAARYFVPAVVSLWMAKQARKHWDSVSAVVVMAASYAASMAVSQRLLAGSTTKIKLSYPLFNGKVTIPRLVAKWIRQNNNLAKFLTKMLAFGPWVLLSLAAALQLAVWLDANGRHSKAKDSELQQEDSLHQSTLSPQVTSASGTSLLVPMHKDTENAGSKQERADGASQHEAQKAVIAVTPAQVIGTEAIKSNDYSHEDNGEPVKSLPSQAEHTVHVGTGRLDAEQKEKMHEAAEEDKQGCHADGSTHGLTTYKTKPLSDSMDDEDSSKEEEDLADSADEEMDSDEDFSEEEDSHEGCSEVKTYEQLLDLLSRDFALNLDIMADGPETTQEKIRTAWSQGNHMPSISVRNKLASILEQSEWKMRSLELQDESGFQLQEKLQNANDNIAQLTAQLAQVSADKEAKVSELRHQVDQLKREHEKEVKDIEYSQAEKLQDVQRDSGEKLEELERQHEAALEELEQKHAEQLRKMDSSGDKQERLQQKLWEANSKGAHFAAELAQLSADKEAKANELQHEADQLKQKHVREVEDIENSHAQGLKEAQHEHEEEVKELESRMAQLERKLEVLQTQKGNEQLAAVEQVKQLQDKLTMQAKNHQTAQEALAIEEKCKRDQLQADVDRLQAVVAERLAEWQQRLAYRVVKLQKPWDSDAIEWDAAKQWEHEVNAEAKAVKPSIAATDDVVDPLQCGTEAEGAPAAVATASGSPEATLMISNDGEVLVSVEPAAIVQKPAEPAASSVEISDGFMDKADGSVKVDVTAVTAAQTAGAHQSETGAGTASGQQEGPCSNSSDAMHPQVSTLLAEGDHAYDARSGYPGRIMTGRQGTTFSKEGRQPSKASNWLLGESNQAGSEVDACRASGNEALKPDEKAVDSNAKGTGSDKDDTNAVPITVDRSLLG